MRQRILLVRRLGFRSPIQTLRWKFFPMSNVNPNAFHEWSSFLSSPSDLVSDTSSSSGTHLTTAFPFSGMGSLRGGPMGFAAAGAPMGPMGMSMPMGSPMGQPMGMPMGMPMGTPMGQPMGMQMGQPMGMQMRPGMGFAPGQVQQPGMAAPGQFPGGMPGGPMQPGLPFGQQRPIGLPLSQPPPKPTFQKMYVKTTAVEQLATTVSTTHITFLWTMLALVSGALITVSCFAIGRKSKKKDGEGSDGSGDSDAESDSESE